jgi:plasmid stabilization system protein ParE
MAKAKVVWRERALADIGRLYNFLYEKNELAAAKAAQVILQGSLLLETSPRLGHPLPDGTRRRELFIPFGSGFYVLRYMLRGEDTVIVIRVWHSRENRQL